MKNIDLQPILKDKIENIKQQKIEKQRILSHRLIPNENHSVFEFNISNKTLQKAEYKPINTTIHWFEAVKMYSNVINPVDIYNSKPISKSEIIKKENCIYISALNQSNALKIIRRDFGLFI